MCNEHAIRGTVVSVRNRHVMGEVTVCAMNRPYKKLWYQ